MEEKLLKIIEVQNDRIDILIRILEQIQKELILVDKRKYDFITEEEMQESIQELIFFIGNIKKNAKQD